MTSNVSPRDRFVTVYGRKPVLEALSDLELKVDKVLIAEGTRGQAIDEIREAAADRAVRVERASPSKVKLLAGNGRHDQGVVADVVARGMRPLADALADPAHRLNEVLLLDGITTPANVGMILRTATAAGIDGIVVPHRGVAGLDPLVIKASAGIAFHAPVLRVATAAEAAEMLSESGFPLVALDASGDESVFDMRPPSRGAFVVGSESTGLSDAVRARVERRVAIPMAGGVDSLNVASATAVLCFELARRRNA